MPVHLSIRYQRSDSLLVDSNWPSHVVSFDLHCAAFHIRILKHFMKMFLFLWNWGKEFVFLSGCIFRQKFDLLATRFPYILYSVFETAVSDPASLTQRRYCVKPVRPRGKTVRAVLPFFFFCYERSRFVCPNTMRSRRLGEPRPGTVEPIGRTTATVRFLKVHISWQCDVSLHSARKLYYCDWNCELFPYEIFCHAAETRLFSNA